MRVRVLGQYVHVSIAVLAVLEAALFFVALYAAGLLRFHLDLSAFEREHGALWPRALLFAVAMFASLLAFGLYSARQRARNVGIVVRVVAAVAVAVAVTAVCFYLFPNLAIGRGVLAVAAVASIAGVSAFRLALTHVVNESLFKRRVLVYGAGKNAASIAALRRRADRRGFQLIGFVPAEGESLEVPAERLIAANLSLLQVCERHDVDEVVVAMDERRLAFPVRELLECRLLGINVTEMLTFLERETGRVPVEFMNPSWMIFGDGFRRGPLRLFSARALDLLSSSLLLIITLPVMVVTTLAIKADEGWRAPVLYRQSRTGLGGRAFELLKFRSMRIDAESGGARWAQKDDPRVTRIGRILRRSRIDELPQLLNVLRGHMSFVGPRPERPEFVAQLSDSVPYYVQRHCVKPGITGWAQLCYPYGSSERDALEKLQYDLYYIKNNTLLFDLSILMQTAEVVVMGKGAR